MLPNERTTRSEVVAQPREVEALVAASDRNVGRPLVDFLREEGINVQFASDADRAFEEALIHRPNIILIDDRLPPSGGIELLQRLKSNTRTHFVPAILFAQDDGIAHRIKALAAGADAVFSPATEGEERRTRLWALLRTQSVYRRQERHQRNQGSAMQERRRWIGGFVHDLQGGIGTLQANFDYLAQAARTRKSGAAEVEECIRDSETVFVQLIRGLRTVLEFERFETGRIAMSEVPLVLSDLAKQAKADLEWHAKTLGKTIEIERVGRDQPVNGDPDHLKEAVINLVGFILRLPKNRRALLRIWSAGGVTCLSVTGDVERIPPEDHDKIFEPYARASKQGPIAHGLGLALAKVVVALHGGSLRVDDVGNEGSALVLELKAETSAPRLRSVE